jgi:hypothetical protein
MTTNSREAQVGRKTIEWSVATPAPHTNGVIRAAEPRTIDANAVLNATLNMANVPRSPESQKMFQKTLDVIREQVKQEQKQATV